MGTGLKSVRQLTSAGAGMKGSNIMNTGLVGIDLNAANTMVTALTNQGAATQQLLTQVQQAINNLLDSWQGNSRAGFEQQWDPCAQQALALIQQLEDIRDKLQATMRSFEEADHFG